VCEVNPLGLVETIPERLAVFIPGLAVRFAHRSFGDPFTMIPKDVPHDRESRR
jgi:hypothetical protein